MIFAHVSTEKTERISFPSFTVQPLHKVLTLLIMQHIRGRYWDRTSVLFRVKEARYRCANRPLRLSCHTWNQDPEVGQIGFPQHASWGFVWSIVIRLEFGFTLSCVNADVAQW